LLQLLKVSATSAVPTQASLRRLRRKATRSTKASRLHAPRLHASRIQRPCVPPGLVGNQKGTAKPRAVVVTVTVEVAGVVPLIDTLLGASVQVEPIGAPVQLIDTVPLKPLSPVTVAVTVVLLPAVTVAVAGVASVKSGVEPPPLPPVPLSATVCGLEASLSAMLNIADSAPPTVGLKKMSYVHDAPAASVAPQVPDG